jgi:hypothetical protein
MTNQEEHEHDYQLVGRDTKVLVVETRSASTNPTMPCPIDLKLPQVNFLNNGYNDVTRLCGRLKSLDLLFRDRNL